MIYGLISGAILMACFVSGLFFFSFWKKTKDKLFLRFSLAFWILALERLVLAYIGTAKEPSPTIYIIRMTAFLVILWAIIQKNREKVQD
jgi:Ca2+/Na+ antiporter